MPCNCDYMEPGTHEIRSREVAQHLVYVYKNLNQKVPKDVMEASKHIYGNVGKLNEMVVSLCDMLTNMEDVVRDAIVYNAKEKESRELANWWEEHQEADRKRIAKEKKAAEMKKLAEKAKSKLSKKELEALKKVL